MEQNRNRIKSSTMKYIKRGTRVLTGNAGIPNGLITEYVGTICFHTITSEGVEEFADISLTLDQFEGLKRAIDYYINTSCRLFPPTDQRYLSPFPDQDR